MQGEQKKHPTLAFNRGGCWALHTFLPDAIADESNTVGLFALNAWEYRNTLIQTVSKLISVVLLLINYGRFSL